MLTASVLVAQFATAPDAPPFFLFVRYRPQSGAARLTTCAVKPHTPYVVAVLD